MSENSIAATIQGLVKIIVTVTLVVTLLGTLFFIYTDQPRFIGIVIASGLSILFISLLLSGFAEIISLLDKICLQLKGGNEKAVIEANDKEAQSSNDRTGEDIYRRRSNRN